MVQTPLFETLVNRYDHPQILALHRAWADLIPVPGTTFLRDAMLASLAADMGHQGVSLETVRRCLVLAARSLEAGVSLDALVAIAAAASAGL